MARSPGTTSALGFGWGAADRTGRRSSAFATVALLSLAVAPACSSAHDQTAPPARDVASAHPSTRAPATAALAVPNGATPETEQTAVQPKGPELSPPRPTDG